MPLPLPLGVISATSSSTVTCSTPLAFTISEVYEHEYILQLVHLCSELWAGLATRIQSIVGEESLWALTTVRTSGPALITFLFLRFRRAVDWWLPAVERPWLSYRIFKVNNRKLLPQLGNDGIKSAPNSQTENKSQANLHKWKRKNTSREISCICVANYQTPPFKKGGPNSLGHFSWWRHNWILSLPVHLRKSENADCWCAQLQVVFRHLCRSCVVPSRWHANYPNCERNARVWSWRGKLYSNAKCL